MSTYLVVNIGCLECGVSSNIVAALASRAEADALAEACMSEFSWREGGQNEFEVFELPEIGVIAEEYRELLAARTKVTPA